MKKLIAILTAAVMLLAALPTLAFTGHSEAPELPEITYSDYSLFNTFVTRYENQPVEHQNEYGETVYTWVAMEGDEPFSAGDTVTFGCEVIVPGSLMGFDEEALASIETAFDFCGFGSLEIVAAIGAEPNYECDYELGFCYPLPGYGNVSLEGTHLVIEPKLDSIVTVVVQGTASASRITCEIASTVGQYQLPAHFSIGKLSYEDGCYFIYEKDIFNVQMRGMKFYTNAGMFDHFTVYFNNHDYFREDDGETVVYYEADHEDDFILEGELFDVLELSYNTVMDFFGFTDDGVCDVMTDAVFLDGCTPVRSVAHCEFGSDAMLGDANSDGTINTEDALIVLRAALGITDNADELLESCDMDGSGALDTTDALYILRMALGLM